MGKRPKGEKPGGEKTKRGKYLVGKRPKGEKPGGKKTKRGKDLAPFSMYFTLSIHSYIFYSFVHLLLTRTFKIGTVFAQLLNKFLFPTCLKKTEPYS